MGTEGGGRGKKLIEGVRLVLWHPQWDRSCQTCEEYLYDHSGAVRLNDDGTRQRRPPNAPTPCQSCPKVPEFARTRPWKECRILAREMTDQNRAAYTAYLRFRATGRFPDDQIVDWYSGLIGDLYDRWQRTTAESTNTLLLGLIELQRVYRGRH